MRSSPTQSRVFKKQIKGSISARGLLCRSLCVFDRVCQTVAAVHVCKARQMRMISADTVHESIQWEWKRNWCKSQKTFPSTRVSSYSYQSARWEKYEHLGRVRNYEPLYAYKSAFQWARLRVLKSHVTQCLCSVSLPQHVCTGPWEWLVPHSCHYS